MKIIHDTADNCWGNAIRWSDLDEFDKLPLDPMSEFHVYGFKSPMVEVGDVFKAEFRRSFVYFEFVSVKPADNPRDMFFGTCKPIKQEMK